VIRLLLVDDQSLIRSAIGCSVKDVPAGQFADVVLRVTRGERVAAEWGRR
jgi:hypothetical protein